MSRFALFRSDASAKIGSGHVRRCLALATALEAEGWRSIFAVGHETKKTVPELTGAGRSIFEFTQNTTDEPKSLFTHLPDGIDLLIVDHYERGAEFEKSCRGWAKRILVIDDKPSHAHDADLLIDQTLDRAADDYFGRVPERCRLLLGTSFALLRPGFSALRFSGRAVREPRISRILVNLGGGSSNGLIDTVISGIHESGLALECDVVTGGVEAHIAIASAKKLGNQVRVHVDHPEPAELIAIADLSIGAAGVSAWERCCLGLPCFLVILADNQREIAAALVEAGAAQLLGAAGSVTSSDIAAALCQISSEPDRLRKMSHAAAGLCDGLGARRVVMEIDPQKARDDSRVTLRSARYEDAELMLGWQNQPEARRFSSYPQPLQRDSHYVWVGKMLADPFCIFSIIMYGDQPAGVLRLNRRGSGVEFQISILIESARRRLGIGKAALSLARRLLPGAVLWAEVLPGNDASLSLFYSAGFRKTDENWLKSDPVMQCQ